MHEEQSIPSYEIVSCSSSQVKPKVKSETKFPLLLLLSWIFKVNFLTEVYGPFHILLQTCILPYFCFNMFKISHNQVMLVCGAGISCTIHYSDIYGVWCNFTACK